MSPRLKKLVLILILVLAGGYIYQTRAHRVYVANYESNREIWELEQKLEEEKQRASKLEWERQVLQGPYGVKIQGIRDGWGAPNEGLLDLVLVKKPPEIPEKKSIFYRAGKALGELVRERFRGVKEKPKELGD